MFNVENDLTIGTEMSMNKKKNPNFNYQKMSNPRRL